METLGGLGHAPPPAPAAVASKERAVTVAAAASTGESARANETVTRGRVD